MSSEAIGWVYRHSPATGAKFTVHLAIADSVNDQYENEFWMRMRRLAEKARVDRGTAQRCVHWLRDEGLLDVLDEPAGGWPSDARRYRFLFPDLPVLYEARSRTRREGVRQETTPPSRATPHPVAQETTPVVTQGKPKAEPNGNGPSSPVGDAAPRPEVAALCELLASRVEQHREGTDRPTVTDTWLRDMRLLVDRGPLGVENPQPPGAEKVRVSIEFLFDELAERGRDGFCWADQVRSPSALRRHWPKMRDTARRQQAERISPQARAINRAAAARDEGQRELTEQPSISELMARGRGRVIPAESREM